MIWYHAMPMTAWMMTEGALTNAFAQTLFVASLALVVALPVERTRRSTVVLLTIVVAAALLTHPSTCAILIGVLVVTGALYAWHGGGLQPSATGVVVAAASATAIAVVLYYASVSFCVSQRAWPCGVRECLWRVGRARINRLQTVGRGMARRTLLRLACRRGGSDRCLACVSRRRIAAADPASSRVGRRLSRVPRHRYHDSDSDALSLRGISGAGYRRGFRLQLGLASWRGVSSRDRALLVAGVWDGIAQWSWAMSTYARVVG